MNDNNQKNQNQGGNRQDQGSKDNPRDTSNAGSNGGNASPERKQAQGGDNREQQGSSGNERERNQRGNRDGDR